MGTNESKLTSADYRSAANKVRKALLEIDLGTDVEHLAVLGVAQMEAEADRLDTEQRTNTESFSFLNELAGAFRSGESNPRPSHFPVLEGIRAVLTHLQSVGRLIPSGGMALTAEQVEDVRLLAHSVVKTNRGAAFEAVDRLRALFPSTEPAEAPCTICNVNETNHAGVSYYHPFTTELGPFDDEGKDQPAPAEPAEDVVTVTDGDVAAAWEDGFTAGCGHASVDCQAPSTTFAAEEETKAEAVEALTEAIRFTVEYVGLETLPPIEGWSWYSALTKYAPEKAKAFLDAYTPPVNPSPAAHVTTETGYRTVHTTVLTEVAEERVRQDAKWGEQNHPDVDQVLMTREGGVSPSRMAEHYEIPTAGRAKFLCDQAANFGQVTYAHILIEEVAEVVEAATRASVTELRTELIQVAAVAVAWVEKLERDPASSPVVPAPTQTGPQTLEGPWDRIEDIPTTVGRVTDRDGDVWEWDGDNWVTPETAILPTTYINRKYAPFVAAEEG
ncbi:hypothetical protein SEA_WHACK_57 [Rhodococcus phage Whack]|uniref:Uncharacterized protein n=1 Tax=Rhodococcus phage Whack TaxID=2591132 RepID=A0A515MKH6_9CAUD|nr:hypothetical protein HWC40_gp57 [Rhodococcus phage Whack]QDM57120.1 hypothetical protein SEA_WHACK_57 [Rhodococcus phage Whack]